MLNDLPLLVINEEGVREEGILQGGRFCVKTNQFKLSSIDSFFDDKTVEQQIAVWIGKVTEYYLFLNLKNINSYIYFLMLSILCLRVFIPAINVLFWRFVISLSF